MQRAGAAVALAAALAGCAGGGASDDVEPRTVDAAPATRAPLLAMMRVRSGPAPNARSSPVPRYEVVVAGLDASRFRLVTRMLPPQSRAVLFGRASWSRDGEMVAFAVEHGPDPASIRNRTDIYVARYDGGSLRRLTNLGDAVEPVWSPDGRTIAFARRTYDARDGSATAAIWVMAADGTQERPLVDERKGRFDIPGEWSPDGSLLAFSRASFERGRRAHPPRVYLVRADGSAVRELAQEATDPAWSPDGRRLAFVSERDRNGRLNYGDAVTVANELYVMNADGSGQRRLTRTKDLNERSPSWSPDGARLAFHRGRAFDNAEGTTVLVVNPDGTCVTPVALDATLATWYARPVWRPGSAPGRGRCARD